MARFVGVLAVLLASVSALADPVQPRPNIVYILCDDLGFGDVHYLNPQRGKIPTPNMDQIGKDGMAFLDCHATSSVCTPSRYSILTGRYSWRTHLQAGVLNGNSPPLIAPGRLTVAELLKDHGYHTVAFGKWHLGLKTAADGKRFTDPMTDSPINHGFEHFFGISASLDMPPFDFIEDDHWTEAPTTTKKWIRTGPAAADFEAVNVLPTLTKKAIEYINQHSDEAKAGKPFFVYLALTSPHTPIVPTDAFKGKSGLGNYGDFVMETDWEVGQVVAALDAAGLRQNTLLIFTSDNGCSPAAGIPALNALGHYPSAQFRGYKSDIWDGGHRIPFLVRWPGVIKPGSTTEQLASLGDLIATVADMLGVKLPTDAGEDSVSMLPALLGTATTPLRESVVHHSIEGFFAIRDKNWKLELCPGSGGWGLPHNDQAAAEGLPPIQLYDLQSDIGEKNNVEAQHPDVVARLTAMLDKYIADGRSTPGPLEKNDATIVVMKKFAVSKKPVAPNGEPPGD